MNRWLVGLALVLCSCASGTSTPRPTCSGDGDVGTLCGFDNPEDVAYVPGYDLLLVSNLWLNQHGGYLSSIAPGGGEPVRMWPGGKSASVGTGEIQRHTALGEPGCPNPSPDGFAPHGVYVDTRDPAVPLLYVVNHGGREAVEIFSFGRHGDETVLFWTACIELPPGTSGNDVVVAPDGEVIVSNYMPPTWKTWSNVKTLLGWNTGDILAWNREQRWRTISGTEASAPNGVEISADGEWVYYSSTGGRSLSRIARSGGKAQTVTVEGMPDNLTWTNRGTLLLASHDSPWAFAKCTREAPCRSPWRVLEVDATSLTPTTIFQHDGTSIGAVASALEAKNTMYFSAVFDDRIGYRRLAHVVAEESAEERDPIDVRNAAADAADAADRERIRREVDGDDLDEAGNEPGTQP